MVTHGQAQVKKCKQKLETRKYGGEGRDSCNTWVIISIVQKSGD